MSDADVETSRPAGWGGTWIKATLLFVAAGIVLTFLSARSPATTGVSVPAPPRDCTREANDVPNYLARSVRCRSTADHEATIETGGTNTSIADRFATGTADARATSRAIMNR